MGGGGRRMSSMPVGKRRNIWGAAPAAPKEGKRWRNPETAGEEHCAETMREKKKECDQGEVQISPWGNNGPREYGADGE